MGRPFAADGVYDFGAERDMTRRVAGLGKVMLKHRLTPPPREASSLHRKLSGAFLASMRVGARVPAPAMLRGMDEAERLGHMPPQPPHAHRPAGQFAPVAWPTTGATTVRRWMKTATP